VLVVEQNAAIALAAAQRAYVPRDRQRGDLGHREQLKSDDAVRSAVPGILMQQFFQALMAGLADGANLRVARAGACPDLQGDRGDQLRAGEIAMFTTYIAYALLTHPHFGTRSRTGRRSSSRS